METLTVLLLAAHLLAMNVASAGPVLAAWLARRAGDHTPAAQARRQLGRRLLWRSLAAMAFGAAGGGALLLIPNAGMRAALGRFPASAYWFAGLELLFSAACIALAVWQLRGARVGGWLVQALAWVSALNLLYHFPPLMAVLGELAADPRWTDVELIDRRALLELWKRPDIMALWAHFSVASFAVSALAAVGLNGRRTGDPSEVQRAAEDNAASFGRIALGATLLQLPVGIWLLAASDSSTRDAILGQSMAASLSFGAAMLGTLGLIQALAELSWGDPRAVRRAGWLLVAVTVLMTATLRTSRATKPIRRTAHGEAVVYAVAGAAGQPLIPVRYFDSSGSFCESAKSPPGNFPSAISSP